MKLNLPRPAEDWNEPEYACLKIDNKRILSAEIIIP